MIKQSYIFGFVSFISLWFFVYPSLWAEDKPSGPVPIKQTVDKWTYSHYEGDILYWQAAGNTADIINGQKEFRVKIITLTYYLGLDDGITSTNRFLVLSAKEGVIKRDEQLAVFKNDVRVIMPKPAATEKETWVLEASVLNLQYLKKKEETRITIQSDEPVTLTQSTSFTITARSLLCRPATVKSVEKNQIILKDAVLTRLATDPAVRGKDVLINAEVMELSDPPKEEEIIVLDGEKEVLLSTPPRVVSSSNGSDVRLDQNVLVRITSEGKAIIYPNFHQIRFQDNAKLIQMEKPPAEVPSGRENGNNARGSLQSDVLNLFLEPNQNDIKKVLAEGNVRLVSREGKVARGEMLEWSPAKHLITVKSRHQVKVWTDNNVLVTSELKIHTGANSPETLGNWKSIETSGGTLTIPPKK